MPVHLSQKIRGCKPWINQFAHFFGDRESSGGYLVSQQMWIAEQMVWNVAFTEAIQYPLGGPDETPG